MPKIPKVSSLFPDVPVPDRGVAETSRVGPNTVSPMQGESIEDFLGPALSNNPKARAAFGLDPSKLPSRRDR